MAEVSFLTKEGYENLKQELQDMKSKGRKEMAKQIAEAREKGDLSENAEYDAAKEAQGLLELKINQFENMLANARILDDTGLDNSKVYILSIVKIENTKTKQKVAYTLVAPKEASLADGKISVDSPIGKALLGRAVGDVVEVQAPAGKMEFKILEISR